MITLPQIEPTSLAIGIIAGIALMIIINIITWLARKAKKPSLEKMKDIVRKTHELLQEANRNQMKLWGVFNEIEGVMK